MAFCQPLQLYINKENALNPESYDTPSSMQTHQLYMNNET